MDPHLRKHQPAATFSARPAGGAVDREIDAAGGLTQADRVGEIRLDPIGGVDEVAGPGAPRHPANALAVPREPPGGHATPSDQAAVRTQGPASVTATVCSTCADRLASAVTTVQPSWSILTSAPPTFSIGSIASTIPGRSRRPDPSRPWFGTLGGSCMARPMPCPTNSRTTE